jgi:hypothetical protein
MGSRTRDEKSEVLNDLIERISTDRIAGDEAMRVLQDLLRSSEGIVREKLQSALEWGEIIYDPSKAKQWGGAQRVKQFFLADLNGARKLLEKPR